jgi:hypothetical protein
VHDPTPYSRSRLRSPVGNGDPLPTGCGVRRLWRRHLDASKGVTRPGEQVAEGVAERLCTNRNCKGNEHDQHGIFGSSGTALVATKAPGQMCINFLLQEGDPVASVRQRRSQTPLSQ